MKTKGLYLVLMLGMFAIQSFAQNSDKRFGVEVNGEVSIVSSDLHDANLNTGLGFETIFQYRFMPLTSVYAGWGYSHFNADQSFAGNDIDFEQTGYIVGLQVKRGIKATPLSWYVRGGLLYCHIETENNDGDIISDSGHGAGFQAGAGIEVDLGKNWSLNPGLKYNFLDAETELEGVSYDLQHRVVSARIGIVKRF